MKFLPAKAREGAQKLPALWRGARYWLTFRYEPAVLPDAVPFLNPIDAICEEPPPRLMWSTHYIVVALFFLLLLIASIAKVDTVVVGPGSLTTESPPIILQPIERGIIRELRVKPGELVHKGQVLAVLDPTFAHADFAALQTQQHSLLAQIKRYEAELNSQPFEASATPDADETLQSSLYQQRQDLYKSRLKVFDEDIQRLNANIRTTEDDRVSLEKQLGYAKELEGMRGQLLQSQNGSKLSYLDAQTLKVRTERDYQDAANHLVELQHGLQSKKAERENFVNDWRRQILDSLVAARTESGRLEESLSKASLLKDLVMVTAPADGVVLDVAKRSVGSIMREAEPLVTIVPSDAPLVADIVISSSDVGHIHPGAEVVLKVDAFPYQRHGLLKGRLLYVSEESYAMTEAGGQAQGGAPRGEGAFHRGRVALTDTRLGHMPEGAHLIPGMTVSAEIKVGVRRVISFFIYPLTRGLDESLREP
jgi:hemolysin D